MTKYRYDLDTIEYWEKPTMYRVTRVDEARVPTIGSRVELYNGANKDYALAVVEQDKEKNNTQSIKKVTTEVL